MSFVESLRSLVVAEPVLPLQAQVWDCFNRGQVLAAAFEVHEVAMKVGFMPDEATSLSLSLAELGTQAVRYARGGVASVFFTHLGWRLEVADIAPTEDRTRTPMMQSHLPRPLSSLYSRSSGEGAVVIAQYERSDDA